MGDGAEAGAMGDERRLRGGEGGGREGVDGQDMPVASDRKSVV